MRRCKAECVSKVQHKILFFANYINIVPRKNPLSEGTERQFLKQQT